MQVWIDLNQFNHMVLHDPSKPKGGATFEMNSSTFEERRARYCEYLMTHEDTVEDAITGNKLKIKDQLIFMSQLEVPGGCNPPQYASIRTVSQLIKEQTELSPKRAEGTHAAQPVLCRAGPGTGKTWMVKQALFLLARKLADPSTAGGGVRLLPVMVFVQRIVRLLREMGDDPSALLQDPNGLMRWYISSEFVDRKEEQQLLLMAYEVCCERLPNKPGGILPRHATADLLSV